MTDAVTQAYSNMPFQIATTVMLALALGAMALWLSKQFKQMQEINQAREKQLREDHIAQLKEQSDRADRREQELSETLARQGNKFDERMEVRSSQYMQQLETITEKYATCVAENHKSFVAITQRYDTELKELEQTRIDERIEMQKLMTQCTAAIEKNTEVLDKVLDKLSLTGGQ